VARRVAVIGAGPAGLVTVKELLDEGHAPTGFEKAPGLGGVFRFDEKDGVVWESCRLTSSGLLTAYSDFPVARDRAEHMTAGEYVGYLGGYCQQFDLGRHIKFGARVESVTRDARGDWRVRWVDAQGVHEERFDAVAVCSGLHQHPHVPRLPGQDTYTGEIMHSAQYRRPAQVAGRKVLIIGAGESGADVVAEVAANAAKAVLSLRRGVAVLPRRMFGKPKDYQTSRVLNSAAHWVFQTRHPRDDRKRNIYRTVFLPLVVVDKCLQILFRVVWEFLPLLWSRRLAEIKANLKTRRMTVRLLRESGGTLTEQFGTKTDDFVRAMALGRCRRAPAVTRFEGRQVLFEDGSRFDPDLVILCTGFETRMPFLDDALARAPRYLHTFNPEVGASLGFVGFLRPAFGAIPPLAELQARWFALLQSGKAELPSGPLMRESIEGLAGFREHIFRAVRGRLDYLVDHTWFCDELAARIGCKPGWRDVRRESLAFRLRFFAGPFVAAQYRLVGPHAKPSITRDVMTSLPIMHPLPDLINLYLRWTMSRVLHRILGPEFAPKLALR
jgi:dimethylaniline monooxygenase (N-oxide forming)